jgi:hypothetical protein
VETSKKNMKMIRFFALTSFLVISVFSLSACMGQDRDTLDKAEGKGFAVLELFTSEGCSSCPPADELLARIQTEAAGKNVYLLAYHVDYWDRQGWKDAFSNADYSRRQAQYGSWLNTPQIYTPQLIVNGQSEFVGSDEAAIRYAILEQLVINTPVTLILKAHRDGEKLVIQYQSTGTKKGNDLLIAIIQKEAQSNVTRGENTGRSLSHVQIVSKLQVEPLSTTGNGNTIITLPKGFDTKNWEIVGLIQDHRNGKISAASKADLNTGVVTLNNKTITFIVPELKDVDTLYE